MTPSRSFGHEPSSSEGVDPVEAATERDAVLHKWARQDTYEPVFVEAAAGTRVLDADGRSSLDAFSQSWYAVVGHGRAGIAAAIAAQAHALASVHAGRFATRPRRQLARRLLDRLPETFQRVCFGSNGSDAVEASLKAARLGTGRQGVVAFSGSYHGASMAATSVTGLAQCREGFGEPVPGTVFAPYPYCYRCPLGLTYPGCELACTDLVEHAIATEGPERIAAIIAEPVAGVGGVVVPPQPYWQRIREIADRYDIWLIFDEVVTGFGRCGSWFALEHYETAPDVITLAKGLTSGYQPLSAAVFNARADAAISQVPWYHGMSFQGHAVACAAALANLDILEHEQLIDRGAVLGQQLEPRLGELAERHRCIGDVRGIGAMWGIELVQDRATKAPFAPGGPFRDSRGRAVDAARWACDELFDTHAVHIGAATNVLLLAPPLIFSDQDVDELVTGLSAALTRVDAQCS